tara:strand:+ start:704 stop:865 length:162 start_codon:yes stop_codon:yes gene_type:complete
MACKGENGKNANFESKNSEAHPRFDVLKDDSIASEDITGSHAYALPNPEIIIV